MAGDDAWPALGGGDDKGQGGGLQHAAKTAAQRPMSRTYASAAVLLGDDRKEEQRIRATTVELAKSASRLKRRPPVSKKMGTKMPRPAARP